MEESPGMSNREALPVACAVLMPTASSIVRERLELFLTSAPVLSVVLIVAVVWAALLI
jgi:hypothetical protein